MWQARHSGVKIRVFQTHGPTLVEKVKGRKMLSAFLAFSDEAAVSLIHTSTLMAHTIVGFVRGRHNSSSNSSILERPFVRSNPSSQFRLSPKSPRDCLMTFRVNKK